MAAEPKPAGVVGERVAATLKHLRRGTSTYELSRQLAEIGWPIRANGLTRIESGARRVDVDDLLALAVVLEVSPNRLLLPGLVDAARGASHAVPVVGNVTAADSDAWAWAVGEKPLVPLDVGEDGAVVPAKEPSGQQVAAFRVENQPHHYAGWESLRSRPEEIVSGLAAALVSALQHGVTEERVRGIFDQALKAAGSADGPG